MATKTHSVVIAAVGDGGVGKTCLLLTFLTGKYPDQYLPGAMEWNSGKSIFPKNYNYQADAKKNPFKGPNNMCPKTTNVLQWNVGRLLKFIYISQNLGGPGPVDPLDPPLIILVAKNSNRFI